MLFSIDGPVTSRSRAFLVEPRLEFFPEALVRPGLDVLGETALEVVAAARRRAHRAEREAERMPDVDQLVGNRRRVGQNAEPAERIDALVRVTALGGRLLRLTP
jgi:hypothetical protein